MKQAAFKIVERTLSNLPVDRKKYLADYLLGQISSQVDTLIDTASHHFPCPHCGCELPIKWGRSGIDAGILNVTGRLMPLQASPWPNFKTEINGSTTCVA